MDAMTRPTLQGGEAASASAQRTLERSAWFAALSPALQADLLQRSVVRRFGERSLVYATGSAPSGFYVVLSGEVRLEHLARSGKFAFYHSLRAGESFGLLSELDGSARFSDARAWVASRVLHLPHQQVQHLYRNVPEAREAFVALICQGLHTTLHMLVEAHSAPPRAQIASILVTMASHEAEERREGAKLTQEAIAAMAGVSRQTASKVLHELRAAGLVELQYGRVRPLHIDRLVEIARG